MTSLMGVITVANLKFHKDQIFRRQDNYFYIKAAELKQPAKFRLKICKVEVFLDLPQFTGCEASATFNRTSKIINIIKAHISCTLLSF
jgi:hypothetical protein